jgi:oxygen-independent coproporphyrinogen-3 oxidase
MTLTATPLTAASPYQGYAYAYPHKTAYRALPEPVPLSDLWAAERRAALFLYLHVPFCEMRCGFCNLFTQARPKEGVTSTYLDALERQATTVRAALESASFARLAIGGGTPTALDMPGLERLFNLAERVLGGPVTVPASVETSPETAEEDKLALLHARGVGRVSIGVQSFVEAETTAVGRPQRLTAVRAALERIRSTAFAILNIDLIYGLPGQTVESWLGSVRSALRYAPEELFLYPLYVRPQTGLGRSQRSWDDLRLTCYREARALLLDEGYEQVSMRMFRTHRDLSPLAPCGRGVGGEGKGRTPHPQPLSHKGQGEKEADGPVYCCQEDGMVGLGCGARSYTTGLHYADEYAVRPEGVRAILGAYVARPTESFALATHGFPLDGSEQRRRYALMSLLQCAGLELDAYRRRFGGDAFEDLPQLAELESQGLAYCDSGRLLLTEAGVERSDAIGPWLYSPAVRARMEAYEWR